MCKISFVIMNDGVDVLGAPIGPDSDGDALRPARSALVRGMEEQEGQDQVRGGWGSAFKD